MATSKEVKGVSIHTEAPIVIPVRERPENQFISKEEFLANRKKEKIAKAKAEAAYAEAMGDEAPAPKKDLGEDGDSPLVVAKKRLADVVSQIQKKSTKELVKQRMKLEDQIEKLEATEE